MPDPTQPVSEATARNIQALQYIFDVARQASVPANVHDQVKAYAIQLSSFLTAAPVVVPAPLAEAVAAAVEKAKATEPAAS